MFGKVIFYIVTVGLAATILFISILRTASPEYSFSQPPSLSGNSSGQDMEIDYELAPPGKVLPDSPLWSFKVARDKVWLAITPSHTRKAEIDLLFADKRLAAAKILFEKGNFELGYPTLLKGETYLLEAFDHANRGKDQGMDVTWSLTRITLASLKHRQVIDEMLVVAPEDARPDIEKTKGISINVYKMARDELNELGKPVPESPFEWD